MLPRSTTTTITLQINHLELNELIVGQFNEKTVLLTQAESLQHLGAHLPSLVVNTVVRFTANTLLARQHKNLGTKRHGYYSPKKHANPPFTQFKHCCGYGKR